MIVFSIVGGLVDWMDGSVCKQLEGDEQLLWFILKKVAEAHGVRTSESEEGVQEGVDGDDASLALTPAYSREICRYGGTELHCIASVVGGVAAQEAVKLLSKQYVPLDNTFVYNGIAGNAGVYKL